MFIVWFLLTEDNKNNKRKEKRTKRGRKEDEKFSKKAKSTVKGKMKRLNNCSDSSFVNHYCHDIETKVHIHTYTHPHTRRKRKKIREHQPNE